MIKYEDECCGCAVPGYPCRGSMCPNKHVPHVYCDKCGGDCDLDEVYDVDGEHVCKDCLLKMFPIVNVEE